MATFDDTTALTFVSQRLRRVAQSEIRRMSRECERVGAINLGQGLCDLPTPPAIADAAKAAIDANRSVYTYAKGDLTLRRAIAGKLAGTTESMGSWVVCSSSWRSCRCASRPHSLARYAFLGLGPGGRQR